MPDGQATASAEAAALATAATATLLATDAAREATRIAVNFAELKFKVEQQGMQIIALNLAREEIENEVASFREKWKGGLIVIIALGTLIGWVTSSWQSIRGMFK